MSGKPRIYVAGVGMLTPVGFDAASTAAAVRAGVSAYKDAIYYNKNLDPMRIAAIPDDVLPPLNENIESTFGLTTRVKRLLRLAAPALEQISVLHSINEPVPLLLSGPEAIDDCKAPLDKTVFSLLEKQTGMKLYQPHCVLMNSGRAGGIQAIKLAFEYFSKTGKDYVLVGGIDTYIDPYVLGTLDRDDRVLAQNIMDGFVPSEAAAFILFVSERAVRNLQTRSSNIVFLPGMSEEAGHRYSEEPYRGDGLANAFKVAIENADIHAANYVYASMNGENFCAKEYAVACSRNRTCLGDSMQIEHPADCLGDIGAAFAPVMLGIMTELNAKPGLLYCSSDGAERGAVCIA